jgi:hypothetical protein
MRGVFVVVGFEARGFGRVLGRLRVDTRTGERTSRDDRVRKVIAEVPLAPATLHPQPADGTPVRARAGPRPFCIQPNKPHVRFVTAKYMACMNSGRAGARACATPWHSTWHRTRRDIVNRWGRLTSVVGGRGVAGTVAAGRLLNDPGPTRASGGSGVARTVEAGKLRERSRIESPAESRREAGRGCSAVS